MTKEIKELYAQLDRKGDFNEVAGEKFKKNPATIRNHWVYGSAVPSEYQESFLEFLKSTLEKQQEYLKSLKL